MATSNFTLPSELSEIENKLCILFDQATAQLTVIIGEGGEGFDCVPVATRDAVLAAIRDQVDRIQVLSDQVFDKIKSGAVRFDVPAALAPAGARRDN